MFYLGQSVIHMTENIATSSNAFAEANVYAVYVGEWIKTFITILPCLVALYVAWDNKKFTTDQKKREFQIGCFEKYINNCLELRKCVEDLEMISYELILCMDAQDGSADNKLREFEVLRKKAIVVSNETIYSAGMLKKLFPERKEIDLHDLSVKLGKELAHRLSEVFDEMHKSESCRQYMEQNCDEITKNIGDKFCNPFKKLLTNCINDAQDEIMKL